MHINVVGRNAAVYGVGNVLVRAAGFILVAIYTRTLSVNDYGILAICLVLIQILVLTIDLGARSALVRFTEEAQKVNQLGTLLGSALSINLFGAVLTSFFVWLAAAHTAICHWMRLPAGVMPRVVLAAFCQCLFQNVVSYYRARNEPLKYLKPNLLLTIVLLVAVAILLGCLHLGVLGALDAIVLAYAVVLASLIPRLLKTTHLEPSLVMLRKLLAFGLPVIIVMSGNLITDAVGLYFLGHFRSLGEVAVYSLGAKLAEICSVLLVIPFQNAYEPFVFANLGSPTIKTAMARLFPYLIIVFAFAFCTVAFGALIFVRLLSPSAYAESYLITLMLLPTVGLRLVYYFGEVLLHSVNKTYLTGSIIGAFTMLSVVLGWAGIQRFGLYGAVAVCDLTTLCVGLSVLFVGLKANPLKMELGRILVGVCCFLLFLCCCLLLRGASVWMNGATLLVVTLATGSALVGCGFVDQDVARFFRQRGWRMFTEKANT